MKKELYKVSERTTNLLVIQRKTNRYFYEFIGTLIFLCFFIPTISEKNSKLSIYEQLIDAINNLFKWPILIVSAILFYSAFRNLYQFIKSDKITIDKQNRTIFRNKKKIINLNDLDFIQIRKYSDSDGDTDYRISLALINGEKYFIDRSSDKDDIISFSEEIGDFVGKEIKFK